jgi:hypothetical protein
MEMGTQLVFDNVFQNEGHFFSYLVSQVLCKNNIQGDINDIDYETDMGRRIFVEMTDGKEVTIRTWNIHDTDDHVYVDYSLYEETN